MVFTSSITIVLLLLNIASAQQIGRILEGENGGTLFWQHARNASLGEEILLHVNGTEINLCPQKRTVLKPEFDFVEILINGLPANKGDIFDNSLGESMWIQGASCGNPDESFVIMATPRSTKGSLVMNGKEYLIDDGALEESTTLSDGLALEDHDRELTDAEREILDELLHEDGNRRFLNDESLSPGEVDLFVLVDINYDIVDALGEADSITYALNLFSWINENVYYPSGFNLQVSEINLRTEPCDGNCVFVIRENGQPSNAHLVHHMSYTGSLGYGSVGGLYTKNDWSGVSNCPSIRGNFGLWERICVSHELGHNLGGIHTHSMSPPLDTCGSVCSSGGGEMNVQQGTIMSYCHQCSGGYGNIAFEFHQVTLSDYIWRLYHSKQNQMNVVAAGTVGLDLSTLEPWTTTTNNPFHWGNIGGDSTTTTETPTMQPTYATTTETPTMQPTYATTTETPTKQPTDMVIENDTTLSPSRFPSMRPTEANADNVLQENGSGMAESLFWATAILCTLFM